MAKVVKKVKRAKHIERVSGTPARELLPAVVPEDPFVDNPEDPEPVGASEFPLDAHIHEDVLPKESPSDLPDTFSPPTQDGSRRVETLPGYVASFWRYSQDRRSLADMHKWGVHPTTVDEPYVLASEKLRLLKSPEGYLLDGDLIVGIETVAHHEQRMAFKRRQAENFIERLPVKPDHVDYAQTRVVTRRPTATKAL